ncbi:MAG: integrase, partial [Pseudomonadota bacterium]
MVKFDALSDPAMTEMMRAYLYARLNVCLPGWVPQLPSASIRQTFNHIRPFFEFVLEELDTLDLPALDQTLLDRYAKKIIDSKTRQPAANALLLKPIWHLYHYREHLPCGGLRFEPWPGQSAASVAGYSSRSYENRTARIPEPILAPLLSWALKYVQIFSKDIFAARAELTAIADRADRLARNDLQRAKGDLHDLRLSRVKRWLAERGREGRGVPGWTQTMNKATRSTIDGLAINWHLINLVAGVIVTEEPGSHLALRKSARDLVARHVSKYGVERGGFDTPLSPNPDTNLPWRSGFDHLTVKREERVLQTAAYILCAHLTGMRDCEVQAMRPGCLDITRSEDGLIERYRVRSTAYKWKRAEGVPADWITIEPVAEAIRVLEHLSKDACAFHGVDTLWPVLDIGRAGKTHVSAEIVRALNAFRDHINSDLGVNDGTDAIPTMHDGKPFKITTRQFRRTLAWHIANRPFGTIAGMIQYKHVSVAAFEGYAGSSHSGFQR